MAFQSSTLIYSGLKDRLGVRFKCAVRRKRGRRGFGFICSRRKIGFIVSLEVPHSGDKFGAVGFRALVSNYSIQIIIHNFIYILLSWLLCLFLNLSLTGKLSVPEGLVYISMSRSLNPKRKINNNSPTPLSSP